MDDAAEAPVPEPGGWLVDLQRARLRGGAAMATFQGLLADEIVAPKSAAEARDPAHLVRAVCAFAETMQERGHFLPGEFAAEALMSWHTQDYLQQALQGGHAQYSANRGGDEMALKSVNACLKSMLADPHSEIFSAMVRLNTAPPRDVRKTLKQLRARNVDAAMRVLDARLTALDAREPLMARHKLWLKSLRKLQLVADDEAARTVEALAARNPLRAHRLEELERDRAVLTHADPAWRAVNALCDMAAAPLVRLHAGGRTPMRAVWPEGPDVDAYAWRVETAKGARTAVFYAEGALFKRYLAVLVEAGAVLPVGSLSLSKGEFARIVPAPARRRK